MRVPGSILLSLALFCVRHAAASTPLPSLLDATIADLAELLESGAVTSVDLVTAYFSRIEEVNDELHAVLEINAKALEAAKASDDERVSAMHSGASLGPLHGIPILVKDNIATFDNNNTAGSVCMLGSKVKSEATMITKLRRAGAIILGKTNMSEWAGARSNGENSTTIGWSAVGGECRAAYVVDQSPSGSSGGSASAVSVGLAPVALGTETDGSIISPSEHSNLVGIKPTMGLTSRHGVIPITHRQDTIGPLCKTVSDCAFVLSVLAGKDVSNDNYTSAQPFVTPPDYMKSLNLSGMAGKRLGVPWNLLDKDWDEFMVSSSQLEFIVRTFNQSIKIIEQAGATVVAANYSFLGATQKDFQTWANSNGTITFQADMLQSINDYLDDLKVRAPGITTIEDLVNCTKHDPRERYPDVDIGLWDRMIKNNYSAGSETTWRAYQNGIKLAGEGAILSSLRDYDLDALILPSFAAYDLPAKIGSPVVTVPMGVFDDSVDEMWDPMHARRFNAVSLIIKTHHDCY